MSDTRERRHVEGPATREQSGDRGAQRVPVRVPRVRSVAGGEIPLRSYEELNPDGAVNELLLRRVLRWDLLPELRVGRGSDSRSHRIASSTVSRGFVQASAAKQMQERDLSAEDVVAVCRRDGCGPGHHNYGRQTLLRLRGDEYGERAGTDSVSPFIDGAGLDISEGVLVIVDGGKGLRAAVKRAFGNRALVQRCQWHKRENVVSYLSKTEQGVAQAASACVPAPGVQRKQLHDRPLRAFWRAIDSACTGLGRSFKTTNSSMPSSRKGARRSELERALVGDGAIDIEPR